MMLSTSKLATRFGYALVVSIETAEQTSNTIHEEVRDRLRVRARARGRVRL